VQDARQKSQAEYFGFLADIGVTKHVGGLKATDEMLGLCHITAGNYVLDVGCGIGATPRYLVKRFGCRVVGIDIEPKMIERAAALAQHKGVAASCEFRVAEAQDLPFEDHQFDVVLVESVNTFLPDRPKAFREYVRVIKPGGYVGMNETTWVERGPDAVAFMNSMGADALIKEEWVALLRGAGLQDIVANAYPPNLSEEAKGRLKYYGTGEMLKVVGRTLITLLKPRYRGVIKSALATAPKHILSLMGYGVYVGRKS